MDFLCNTFIQNNVVSQSLISRIFLQAAQPKSIRKTKGDELVIQWNDNHESKYTFAQLRDVCPCAGCQGETVLFREYRPAEVNKNTPNRYTLTGIQQVGSYAVQLFWGDGHATGIYTWALLSKLCECNECSRTKYPTQKNQ